MTDLAISKIKKELSEIKGDKYADAVKKPTAEALMEFCRQDVEFAQAVVQCDKTLGDCLKTIMAGCGSSISDITVYRKAVQFYFSGAEVRMQMTIDLCGAVADAQDGDTAEAPRKNAGIVLDLTDFL